MNGIRPNIEKNIIKFDDVKPYLSKSLTSGLGRKKGKAYIGQIFSNLGSMATTKFHRIQNFFNKRIWVNNTRVMKKLEKKITNLTKTIESGINIKESTFILQGVLQMRHVCSLLEEGGANEVRLKDVENKLNQVEQLVTEGRAKNSIFVQISQRRIVRPGGRFKKKPS